MGERTDIAWATSTFNPWIGCTKVGPGCDNCYAEALMDKRFGRVAWGSGNTRKRTSEANWRQPLRWNAEAAKTGQPWRVFCASLADVFDNDVDPAWRADLFDLIRRTPALTWMLLTKRIGNAEDMLPGGWYAGSESPNGPLPNVWLGATVVNQEEADRDIPKLLRVPAAVRFLSIEPMLGLINLTDFQPFRLHAYKSIKRARGILNEKVDWVIVGGESGKQARPFHIEWARDIVRQCKAAGVPVFVKQMGAVPFDPLEGDRYEPAHPEGAAADPSCRLPLVDRKGGDPAEWPEDLRVREWPVMGRTP